MVRLLVVCAVMVGGGCSQITGALVEYKKASYRDDARQTQHTVRVDGHDVVYLDRGTGTPLLLVHGFGADKDNWTLMAAAIPDAYRVIALDLPGFGESTRDPLAKYDIPSQAARVEHFLDALGIARAHLVGNSMGGNIAGYLAIHHPERVMSLGLVDSAGVQSPTPSELANQLAKGNNPLLVDSVDDFTRFMAFTMENPPAVPWFIKGYFAERAATNKAFNARIFSDINTPPTRLEADLGRITMPTLVVWGDHDRVIDPSAAQVFMHGLPHATLVMLPRCGHAPMLEYPRETASHLVAFLEATTAAVK